jgi:hypothetical protein
VSYEGETEDVRPAGFEPATHRPSTGTLCRIGVRAPEGVGKQVLRVTLKSDTSLSGHCGEGNQVHQPGSRHDEEQVYLVRCIGSASILAGRRTACSKSVLGPGETDRAVVGGLDLNPLQSHIRLGDQVIIYFDFQMGDIEAQTGSMRPYPLDGRAASPDAEYPARVSPRVRVSYGCTS